MPTKHRQQMIDQGYAKPHHGHDPDAVRAAAELAAADLALLDAAEAAEKAAAENAEKARAARRTARAARHALEAEMRGQRRTKLRPV